MPTRDIPTAPMHSGLAAIARDLQDRCRRLYESASVGPVQQHANTMLFKASDLTYNGWDSYDQREFNRAMSDAFVAADNSFTVGLLIGILRQYDKWDAAS